MTVPTQQISLFVPGAVDEATGAGNVARLQLSSLISTTTAATITAVWVRHSFAAPGGATTTLVVADADWDGAATASISNSLAAADTQSTPTLGSVPIAANASFYLYFTAAGQHSDLQVVIEYQLAGAVDSGATSLYPATVIAQARFLFSDPAAVRISDANLYRLLADAQREIMTQNPWDFLNATGASVTAIPETCAAGVALAADWPWKAALVAYLVWQMAATLDADTTNLALVKEHRDRWFQLVYGGAAR